MDYFTADLHLKHNRIRELASRPFDTTEKMNHTIIDNINKKVTIHDRLFVIGDFCWGDKTKELLNQLTCNNVWLIKGNHDRLKGDHGFTEVRDYYANKFRLSDGTMKKIVLFHYPIREWDQWHRGSWHLFGHVHGGHKDDPRSYSLDVGVDCHDFQPLSLLDIEKIMAKKNWIDPMPLLKENLPYFTCHGRCM